MPVHVIRPAVLAWALCFVWTALFAQQTTPTTPEAAADETVTSTLPLTAQRPSLMVKKGDKELELRLSYSHSSRNAIFVDGIAILPVIVVGQVGVERIRRDVVTLSATGRYGLADNLMGEIKVPFRYEHDRMAVPEVSPPQERTISGTGIGDLEGGLYYQLPRKNERSIRWIVSVSAKSATGDDAFEIDPSTEVPLGTGFWNTKVGLTGVKVVDPVAVYWNAGFTYNWERTGIPITITDPENGETSIIYVNIKPGNTFDVGGGFAYAVNHRFSVNTGVTISFNGSTTSNGESVANSAVTTSTLRLGAVWLTDNRQPIDLSLSIGLTDDSPDFSLEYRHNIKF